MTAAEMLIERGRKQGHDEGRIGALREILLKQLHIRFGTLPDGAAARVNTAEKAQLDIWLARVLAASTLADVLGDG